MGLMLSTIDFNMAVNTNAAMGAFELQVERVEAFTVQCCDGRLMLLTDAVD